jgi:hypothetical protein
MEGVMASRAKTKEEAREAFLDQLRAYVRYWANETRVPDAQGKLDGLAFSFLNILDGTSASLPSMDVVLRPHADDEAYHKAEGTNWWPTGLVINDDVMLHEHWYSPTPGAEAGR